MKPFKDLSITTKLTLLVVQSGAVSLGLASIAFVGNDIRLIRSAASRQTMALADVLAVNTAAVLDARDVATAEELLAALESQPTVELACMYDRQGNLFAAYGREGAHFEPPPAALPASQKFSGGELQIWRPVERRGELVGTIFLHASMRRLHDPMLRYVNIVAVVLIVSMAASIVLSSRMQRMISVPIVKLAEAAARISSRRDYSIRVQKTANDELGTLYDQFNAMLDEIARGEAALKQAHDDLEAKVSERTAELSRINRELSREVAERQRAEEELESVHGQLVQSARRAGMAEIATGVLHNVGNVLNSINVSATLASDRIRQSKVAEFFRAVRMIEEHQDHLPEFLSQDPKGKRLPEFLSMLAAHLADERTDVLAELDSLVSKVSHVKTIVATQQSYAGVSGVLEAVDVAATLDDALKIDAPSFNHHRIQLIRQYEDLPRIRLDRHKVLEIVINLIENARDSLAEVPAGVERRLTVETSAHGDRLRILVSDNGVGIAAENLTRIFSHGFTTKQCGHGFGLHASANAAAEMGGSLSACSEGPGRGATFVLDLPLEPAGVFVRT